MWETKGSLKNKPFCHTHLKNKLAFRQRMQIRIHLRPKDVFGYVLRAMFLEEKTQTMNDCDVYRYETYVCNIM